MMDWISVKEQMPEPEVEVLVLIATKTVTRLSQPLHMRTARFLLMTVFGFGTT